MSTKQKFISDLVLGQFYEEEYIKHRAFNNIHHPKDKCFKDYDFKNLDTEKSYEVKADRRAKNTGNLFIEFEFKGEHSGINATKADYWIHYITETENVKQSKRFLKIKTEKLRKMLLDNYFEVRKGGDNYQALGFLVPISFIKKYIRDV